MKTHARRTITALVATTIALLGACAPGEEPQASDPSATAIIGSPDPTASATPPPTTPPPTTPPPTTPPPPLILKTPQAAAEHLYDAWKANDTASANLGASSAAVSTLFAKTWAADTYFFGGCTEPTAPSECDYNWSSGIIAMMITGDSTAGFKVSAVSFGNAG